MTTEAHIERDRLAGHRAYSLVHRRRRRVGVAMSRSMAVARLRVALSMTVVVGAFGIAMLGTAATAQAAGLDCTAGSGVIWSNTAESCDTVQKCNPPSGFQVCDYYYSAAGKAESIETPYATVTVQAYSSSGTPGQFGYCEAFPAPSVVRVFNLIPIETTSAGNCNAQWYGQTQEVVAGDTARFDCSIQSSLLMVDPEVQCNGLEGYSNRF
jgi:hypothetical protein